MAYSYYIYYRIAPDKAAVCEPKIKALLAVVEQATGVGGRLLKKRGEPLLWMEIYENVRDEAKFEWELAEAVSRLGVPDCLQPESARRTECFVTGE